jgi:hypothetical protein
MECWASILTLKFGTNRTAELSSALLSRKLLGIHFCSVGIFSEATDGTMCPGVESASKNKYQENSWG